MLNQGTPLLLPGAWLQLSSAWATANVAEISLALLKETAKRGGEGPSDTSSHLTKLVLNRTQKIYVTPLLAHALPHWTAYSAANPLDVEAELGEGFWPCLDDHRTISSILLLLPARANPASHHHPPPTLGSVSVWMSLS